MWSAVDNGAAGLVTIYNGKTEYTQSGKALAKVLNISESEGDLLFNLGTSFAALKSAQNTLKISRSSGRALSEKELSDMKTALQDLDKSNKALADYRASHTTNATITEYKIENTANKLIPDSFVVDVTKHNNQVGVLNSGKTGISGAHNQNAFLESIEATKSKLVGAAYTDSRFPGLIEYEYQIPAIFGNGPNAGKISGYKRVETKTTYNSSILSDAKVADMSNQAAKQAESYFQANPNRGYYDIKVDGYWFRVTHDVKNKKITNSFITLPPRNAK